MNKWHSSTCRANGINIHYTRTGGDKPPLVLLHGLMTNGLCWSSLARSLESQYDVIMPDARGHGKSSVPDFGYSYDDLANDVIGLIEVLKLTAPILLGHSMGAMTAALLSSRKPNLIGGLILDDPPFLSPKVQRIIRDSDVADNHRQMLNMSLDEVMAKSRGQHVERSEETIELFAKARLQTSIAAFDVLTPPYPNYKMFVSDIDVECLVIFSDRGIISPNVAKELQQLNPRLSAEQIKGAGHNIHIDQPERFADVVKAFLCSL